MPHSEWQQLLFQWSLYLRGCCHQSLGGSMDAAFSCDFFHVLLDFFGQNYFSPLLDISKSWIIFSIFGSCLLMQVAYFLIVVSGCLSWVKLKMAISHCCWWLWDLATNSLAMKISCLTEIRLFNRWGWSTVDHRNWNYVLPNVCVKQSKPKWFTVQGQAKEDERKRIINFLSGTKHCFYWMDWWTTCSQSRQNKNWRILPLKQLMQALLEKIHWVNVAFKRACPFCSRVQNQAVILL